MFEVAIIGGGVVGSAILNKLTRLGISAVLLEKNLDVATGSSKANSGIVHAGFDCHENTLKAKLNVRGNALYEKLCKQLKVPFKRVGAIVCGNDFNMVETLYKRGIQNNVKDMEILDRNKLESLVPNICDNICCGLLAKTSGIVSPFVLSIALCEEAVLNGGVVKFNFEFTKIEKMGDYYNLYSRFDDCIQAKFIVNAAGFGYNDVAEILQTEKYPIVFRLGEYYLLDTTAANLVNYTIFPLPSEAGKGVLISPTIDGNIIIGPSAVNINEFIEDTTIDGLEIVKKNANTILKNIPLNKNIRVFGGVRVIVGDDFIIEKSVKNQNVINIAGICSPGLTAAPAIAEMIAELLGYNNLKEKKMIERKAIEQLNGKTLQKQNELIKKDRLYGKIICKCEMVSEKEIVDAIHSPLKPISIDAIKRRTRAGMGRCQGVFCTMKVAQIISRECNIPIEQVLKENMGSNLVLGEIK